MCPFVCVCVCVLSLNETLYRRLCSVPKTMFFVAREECKRKGGLLKRAKREVDSERCTDMLQRNRQSCYF